MADQPEPAARPARPEQPAGPEQPRPRARDLVRRRSRRYAAPGTGRMHHIGAAPDEVPVHTDEGVATTRATSWQLADRTAVQLQAQQERAERAMRRAAQEQDYEAAGRHRDELEAVRAELARRAAPPA